LKQPTFVLLLFVSLWTHGQNVSENLRFKKIIVFQPEIQIDTFSIQPFDFAIFINNRKLPETTYRIDFVNARLYLKNFQNLKNKTLAIKYRVFPEYLRKTYQRYQPVKIQKDSIKSLILPPTGSPPERKPFDGLETKGSITRGFNAGNRQSLVMISGLDLKIEGKLSEKIKIKAVLSDDNLPQAYAGISKSYKEFNRIYMQLSAPAWEATGGDLIWNEQNNYFLKFNRKTQGLSLQFGKDSNQLQISGAYVEGRFALNRFNGIDGNQGPYLLKGNHDETYIFIIPQSEKVYVNGKLLQRGESADYTINYETAELRFNPTFPIIANHRITVEFNYSNQQYVRYLSYNKYRHQSNKLTWSVINFFEGDIKNQTLLYDLTKNQVEKLRNAGDKPQNMWTLAAMPSAFNQNKILYRKISDGNNFYFEYTDADVPDLYEVKFTYAGKNKGDYKIKKVTAIGKIYEYAGSLQGDYTPYLRLTPPQQKAYLGFGLNYRPSNKTQIILDGIVNNYDQNTFSNINDNDNTGGAIHTSWIQNIWHKHDKNLKTILNYDFIHPDFAPLDPYRSPEFNRDWQTDSIFGKQHFLDMSVHYNTNRNNWQSGYRYYQLRDSLQSGQFYTHSELYWKKWHTKTRLTWLKRLTGENLEAIKWQQQLTYNFDKHQITGGFFYDKRNLNRANILDSLNYKQQYIEFKYLKKDSSRTGYEILWRHETNDSIIKQLWQKMQISDITGFKLIKNYTTGKLNFFSQWRHTRYIAKDSLHNYFNIQLRWKQTFIDKLFATDIHLGSYNGNTLRDEVIFVETPPGQGVYTWNDYNQNGIKEINEFEVAVYSDQARYIRVILPSKNYIATRNNLFNSEISFNPGTWQKKSFFKRIFGIFRFQLKYDTPIEQFDFQHFLNPAVTLSKQQLWQQDWFLNRSRKKYHLHVTYQFIEQKQLLYVGLQTRLSEKYTFQSAHSFNKQLVWKQKFEQKNTENRSENYSSKNFRLQSKSIEQNLSWHKLNRSSFNLFARYDYQKNLWGNEKLQRYKTGLHYFHTNKQNRFDIELQFVQNQLTGNNFSPVAYQMLEGLQTGKNIVLNSLLQQEIKSYLLLNLQYGFRISENHQAIHTGGIQLKMIF